MPKPRASKLETATARRKLAPRKKPYAALISPGISLCYRRNAGAGTWSVRATNGQGGEWLKRIALADDLEAADGRAVLTYWQAVDKARELARRQPGDADDDDDSRPITVAESLTAYASDLAARGAAEANSARVKAHLPASLLSKPVALLSANELKRWRGILTAKGLAPATVNRTIKPLRAALTLAAKHDPHRITNQNAWRVGLASLADAGEARNVILPDHKVREFIAAAYDTDRKLGVLMDTLAVTGARPSQATRLTVADLRNDPKTPTLTMLRSAKGGARDRTKRKRERFTVAITPALAAVLAQEATGRPADARLLLRNDGAPWNKDPHADYRREVHKIVEAIGLNPDEVTAYALRHSSIVRMLLRNVPIRLVAACHDTSVAQIEKNYSRFITEHSDGLTRGALLQIEAEPPAGRVKIVAMARR